MPPRAALRVPALAVLVALVALGAAQAAELTGTDRADRLVGTTSADTIRGRGGNDRIEGRRGGDHLHGGAGRDTILGQAGPDRIAVQADGARDTVVCGLGLDVVNAEHHDVVADDCEVVTRQLSRDPFTGVGQHETQVEPDSASFGSTIVAVFQSGRIFVGRRRGNRVGDLGRRREHVAAGIPRAGRRSHQRPGRGLRPTAPNVADRDARVVTAAESSHLLVSRSTDGLVWSRPAPAADDPAEDYDKEWLACDTWTSSPFYGRCYLVYLDVQSRRDPHTTLDRRRPHVVRPVAAPVPSPDYRGNGAYPVIRPDGALLVFFSVYGSIDPASTRSSWPGRSTAARRSSCLAGSLPCSRRTSPACEHLRSCPRTSMPAARSTRRGPTAGSARSARRTASSSRPRGTAVMDTAASCPVRAGREPPIDRFVPALAVDPVDACSGKRRDRRLLGDAVARLCRVPGRRRLPRSVGRRRRDVARRPPA